MRERKSGGASGTYLERSTCGVLQLVMPKDISLKVIITLEAGTFGRPPRVPNAERRTLNTDRVYACACASVMQGKLELGVEPTKVTASFFA